ncbi:hypothetical protein CYMTET_30919 [Cymbomonas tetramitiformis]|uniref:IPT/TIG domain-containing protein n=1 Tax=Cymbomonas tetramitiformis TaxID=36881 RepID=A0AAE0FHV3_9CHLO|nr:hypothetical protein CYMTET_30919 [Cymbomonas tetramitiformis]
MYVVDHRFTIRRFPDLLAYSSINVEEMVPHRCQTTGGRVHIRGSFAIAANEELVVRSGNALCEVLSHAHNQLLVDLVSGTGTSGLLTVEVKDKQTGEVLSTVAKGLVLYLPPSITRFWRVEGEGENTERWRRTALSESHSAICATTGGQFIGVDGKNFGEDDSALSVLLENTICEILQSSHQEITIRVPPGVGCYPTLSIRVGGQFANAKTPLNTPRQKL